MENNEKNITVSIAETENTTNSDMSSPIVKMIVVLTVICTVIAGLLSVVNYITKDVISENNAKAVREAIFEVFREGDRVEPYATDNGDEIYLVFKNNKIIGYR